jgi:hypothetical protein
LVLRKFLFSPLEGSPRTSTQIAVRNDLLHYSNRDTPDSGRDAFRKIAFELMALNETTSRWFRRFLHSRSFDLNEAANGMIGLSHATNGDLVDRAIWRHRVEKSLLLQLEFSDEDFERICKRQADEYEGPDFDDFVTPDDRVEELFIYSNCR